MATIAAYTSPALGHVLPFAGVLLVTGVDATVSPTALLGDAMALAGGAAADGYSLTAETARREMSTASYSAVANSVCAALTLVLCLALGTSLVGFSAVTWAEVAVVASPDVLHGRRFGNVVLVAGGGNGQALPLTAVARRVAADPFPARVEPGAAFGAGADVVTDATAVPSPRPPRGVFGQ